MGLTNNGPFLQRHFLRHPGGVELVCFAEAIRKHLIELLAKRSSADLPFRAQAQLDGDLATSRDIELIVSRRFGPGFLRVDRLGPAMNDEIVKSVLDGGA